MVTIWWQDYSQKKSGKIKLFATLMSKRYDTSHVDCVEALNMIDVVFCKDKSVRMAWRGYYESTQTPKNNLSGQRIDDKYLKLLEVIARNIGYKDIYWDDIKQYYLK